MRAALPIFKQMTIVGVGLLGGSLGMICKQQGLVETVIGAGRRAENLKKAVALKAIDRYSTNLAEAASGSDLLVLATPVDTFEDALKTCAPRDAVTLQPTASTNQAIPTALAKRSSASGSNGVRTAMLIVAAILIVVNGLRVYRSLPLPYLVPQNFKYEGVSPAGSHKPNTAVAQAWYNKEAGVKRLSTETGAGQWGSSLAFAGSLFGIDVTVFQVRVSYDQKPYRRALMELKANADAEPKIAIGA